tara:strand:+ start:356 stop:538 length:183 start_codon:yes stop_codon:yes gene_type:complete
MTLELNKFQEEYMTAKVEQARELLRELDRVTDRAFSMKVRKIVVLQEALNETRKQLGVHC